MGGHRGFGRRFGAGGGIFGDDSAGLEAALTYARAHGGGTVAIESQSSAASAIVSSNADVAGLGGFSGRESAVSVGWLAAEVKVGRVRYVLTSGVGGRGSGVGGRGSGGGAGAPGRGGDTRTGSERALSAAAKACRAVTVSSSTAGSLYDCTRRAVALAALAALAG